MIYSDNGWRGYGNLVVLRHAGGYVTVYAHNRRNLVDEGEVVRQGAAIAEVGSTGHSTGPHCHFEIRIDGKPQIVNLSTGPVTMDEVKQLIRAIPDFPQPGILFRDITPVLGNPQAFAGGGRDVGPGEAARADPYRRHRVPGLHPRGAGGGSAGAPVCARPQAGEAAASRVQGRVRAGVRLGLARDARGRRRAR